LNDVIHKYVDPATGEFAPGGVAEQTAQSFENIKNILAEAGLTTANIVKTTVFLADMSLFAEMNGVYAKYFDGDFPARSAVAVKALPKGAFSVKITFFMLFCLVFSIITQ
jgi:2-iminobutanoate/2-iminopropanoate deaminase